MVGIAKRRSVGEGGGQRLTGYASACIALHLSSSRAGFFLCIGSRSFVFIFSPAWERARAVRLERERSSRPRAARRSRLHTRSARPFPPPASAGSGWVARRSLRHLSPRPIDVRRAFFPRIRTKKREDKKVRERHYPCCRGPIAIRKEAFFMGAAARTPAPALLSLLLSLSLFNSFSLPWPPARFV